MIYCQIVWTVWLFLFFWIIFTDVGGDEGNGVESIRIELLKSISKTPM